MVPWSPAASVGYAVRWVASPPGHVEVSGLKAEPIAELRRAGWGLEQWQRLLTVHAEQGDLQADIGLPPMTGEYRVEKSTLHFVPRFPLVAGVRYRATFHPGELPGAGPQAAAPVVTAMFQAPSEDPGPATVVRRIYPSAAVLPENQLKFYVYFSAPMSRGQIYDHIHLREASGKEVELPFLQINEELWNDELTRITLLIDPGRIKRGVRPLEEIGPALVNGGRYELQIDRAWQDAHGRPLADSFQKQFRVGPPDRSPPDPKEWRLQPPKARSREPLSVTFPDPLDYALALRMIRVTGHSGAAVAGTPELEAEERRWVFIPSHPWTAGAHQLVVATTIEDLAGNNIGKPFEVDLFENVQRHLTNSTVSIPFDVR